VSTTISLPVATEGLPPRIRDVVAEVIDEAVMSATGADEGRASVVSVSLNIGQQGATVTVRDDGAALVHRDVFGSRDGRIGVAGMRRRLVEAGGELDLRRRRPRGVEIVGHLPFEFEDGTP
jgi:signal transduction histidine kinase